MDKNQMRGATAKAGIGFPKAKSSAGFDGDFPYLK
jgi:hypothetical protein